ncbi:hypothetical protein CA54_59970 [Symmachiella macrocystis]|uniref:Subtilase-type serine protease n=1 Tax=Symmachiella macrocystis TaxID=2527985 RepID=A0A5C6B1G5_9PLAN|nr:hypothetical protein CA54_59970 [Symmachiella macrocystis]
MESFIVCAIGLILWSSGGAAAQADGPAVVLNHVFPAGGQAGTQFEVDVAGTGLDGLTILQCSHPGIGFQQIAGNKFRVTIPETVLPGQYDLRTVGQNGLSSPRTFSCGTYAEQMEAEPNDALSAAQRVAAVQTVNGRIAARGDQDHFQFTAQRGERIVIECWAERIDSPLRAVLEVYDSRGRRLRVNRGYFGIDPLIDFVVPKDGDYIVRVFDLVYTGSDDAVYRLEIGNHPRVAFAVPAIVERDKPTTVTLYGWNLNSPTSRENVAGDGSQVSFVAKTRGEWDRRDVEVNIPGDTETSARSLRLRSAQATLGPFAYHLAGSHVPVLLAATDLPVIQECDAKDDNDSRLSVPIPCAISGQLLAGDERDVFAFEAQRGEILWLEGFGERLGSPVDLDLSILSADGETEFARFSDDVRNLGGVRFPSAHLDPAGSWVVPADGRYLILVRNLIGGLDSDPRRVYALTICRQEPGFHVVAIPRAERPESMNVQPGGRTLLDVLAFRQRGMSGSIRVSARNLPPGLECPPIWLGPGVDSAPLVITATRGAAPGVASLDLVAEAPTVDARPVKTGTMVRTGRPNGWGRLTADRPVAISGPPAPLRIIAEGHEPRLHELYGELKVRHAPGGIVDVAVHVERAEADHQAEVKLIGTGLPPMIGNQTVVIPPGQNKGYISFYLPPTLNLGQYSLAIRAETTAPDSLNEGKPKSVAVISNVVSFEVQRPAFVVKIDPYAPKTIRRGEVIQINYTAQRINGFISKIHTELAAPVKVAGIRGRGVTFVGQTDSGTIQIIANDDAKLGQQPFLRLYGIGTVEDQPIYHGSCFLELEVVE